MITINNKKQFTELSDHLFWDVDKSKLSLDDNKKIIIQRVLDYGLFDDWKIIQSYYGLDEIARTATQIRDLGKKSANFIATITGTPERNFLCYTLKQSKNKHWDF